MSIATYASKVFQVSSDKIYTFDDFQYSSALQTEKQDTEGTKPSTYNKGSDLDSLSFKINLDVSYGVNPRTEWEDWKEIMNSSVAYPFILGGKPLGIYNFLVVGVAPSNVKIDNIGNILAMDLEVKFEEYVRAGAKKITKSTSTKKSGSKSNGKSIEAFSDSEYESLIEE